MAELNEVAHAIMQVKLREAIQSVDRGIETIGSLLKSAKLNADATAYFERQLSEHLEAARQLREYHL